MTYQIRITKTAERDLVQAADYIEFSLKNPAAAERLLDQYPETRFFARITGRETKKKRPDQFVSICVSGFFDRIYVAML